MMKCLTWNIEWATGSSPKGKRIKEIVEDDGWEGFRRLEKEVIQAVCAQDNTVIATGGGAVLDPGSRALMANRGIVVWLDPPVARVAARLDGDRSRPLLDGEPIGRRLAQIRADRAPLYADVAHTRVAIDAEVDEVADAVAAAIETLEAA